MIRHHHHLVAAVAVVGGDVIVVVGESQMSYNNLVKKSYMVDGIVVGVGAVVVAVVAVGVVAVVAEGKVPAYWGYMPVVQQPSPLGSVDY